MRKSSWVYSMMFIYILLSAVSVSPVYACSGGPPTWEVWLPQLVEQSDVIVIGHYVELDDTETNGILRVSAYLHGQGAEHLLIRSETLAHIENNRNVNRRYSRCTSIAQLYTTGSYLYFLSHQGDGTYSIRHRRYFEHTYTADAETEASIDRALLELIQQITAVTGQPPQTPDTGYAYPRTTPILITTTEGEHFLLPVDTVNLVPVAESELADLRRDQHECAGPPCTVFSPNGLNRVSLAEAGQEPPSDSISILTEGYVESSAVGERIAFSTTSDTYALWHGDQIELYALWYPHLGYPDYLFADYVFTSEFLTAIPAGNSVEYPIAWSPDGRMLVFSTDEGLWLWDALTLDYPPQLLFPTTTDVPVARYFSPQGRYLAITEGDRRYIYDFVTQRELPDGYVSPDDRILLVFDTAADGPTTLEVAYLAPGIRRSEFYPEVQYLDVAWIDDAYFAASITGISFLRLETIVTESASGEIFYEAVPYVVEEPFVDVVTYHASGIYTYDQQVPYLIQDVQMRGFTYKAGPGLIKISDDGYHLRLNNHPLQVIGTLLSLESLLSAPIEDVVWLPSAFYYVRN